MPKEASRYLARAVGAGVAAVALTGAAGAFWVNHTNERSEAFDQRNTANAKLADLGDKYLNAKDEERVKIAQAAKPVAESFYSAQAKINEIDEWSTPEAFAKGIMLIGYPAAAGMSAVVAIEYYKKHRK